MTAAKSRSGERVQAARYRALDLLATLVAIVDRDGVVRWSNAALEDLLGISRRTITGLPELRFDRRAPFFRISLECRSAGYATQFVAQHHLLTITSNSLLAFSHAGRADHVVLQERGVEVHPEIITGQTIEIGL